jgi:tetratricopeptide (TPR) repeat protein
MTPPTALQPPLDLGLVDTVDPFTVQPGIILFERFCVLGQVRHAADTWRVEVTDLLRRLGNLPHHRLVMHVLPAADGTERLLRSALPAHGTISARIDAVISMEEALCLLTPHSSGRPVQLPMSHFEALTVARTLARLLGRLHAIGIGGVRFDLRDIRLDFSGELQFASVHHLIGIRSADGDHPDHQGDVQSMVDVLRSLEDEAIGAALAEAPPTAAAIVDRLDSIPQRHARVSAVDTLPAVPPFVGRELLLRRVIEGGARVSHSGVEIFAVTSDPGAGRSRLVDQLSIELARGNSHVVVQARFHPDAPHMGLSVMLDAIADAVDRTYGNERDAIVARIRSRVEVDLGLLTDASPRLRGLLGAAVSPPPTTLDERQVRYGAAVADLLGAISTPERPVALLLDDLEHTDASIGSALYQLSIPTRTDPILIVLTHLRETEVALPRRVVPLQLGPFPMEAVRTMLRAALPGKLEDDKAIAARLFAATSGAPERTWQLLRRWIEHGVLARDERNVWALTDAPSGVDSDVVVFLTRPWADLGDEVRTLAGLAVIRSEAVEPGWLGRVTGWSASLVREAASELVKASFLHQDDGGRLHFTSDATREAARRALSSEELQRAHQLIAHWLQRLDGASASQRAWHQEHAAAPGRDEPLAQLHLEAGQLHLAQCDARRALWHFERAVERTGGRELLVTAHEGRADALLLLDRNHEALQSYLELYDNVSDPLQALQTAGRVVKAFYMFGDEEAAFTIADRALRMSQRPLPSSGWQVLTDILLAVVHLATRRKTAAAEGDAAIMVHCWLVASSAPRYALVGPSSMFRALAAATGRSSAATAWARAYFSVVFASSGLLRPMTWMLARAEADARRADDGMALGIVGHFRGLNELTLGSYESGQNALSRALRDFRNSGDLSLSGAALTAIAQFSMDREPVPVLRMRLRAAIAAAWRNRHRSLLPMLHGMELLVSARQNLLVDDRLGPDFAFLDEPSTDYFVIAGRAYTALALQRAGFGERALVIARQAYDQYLACTVPIPFLVIALVAYVEAVIATDDDPVLARKLLRQLKRRARSVLSLRNAVILAEAKLAIRRDRTHAARDVLVRLIETAGSHKEGWYVLDAHRLMAQVLAGDDPTAAEAHTNLGAEIAQQLGINQDRASATPAPPPHADRSVTVDVALWPLVDALGPTLRKALPPDVALRIGAAAGVRALGTPEQIELLVINLVLTVRDALEPPAVVFITIDELDLPMEDAARAPVRRPGRWSRIQIHVEGGVSPGPGALSECRSLCGECGGFLEVVDGPHGLSLCASLPAPDGSPTPTSQVVAIVHTDDRCRSALVDGVRRLGWTAVAVPVGEQLPDDAVAVFAERECATLLSTGIEVIEVVRRTEPVGPRRCIRSPFLVGELEELLTSLA